MKIRSLFWLFLIFLVLNGEEISKTKDDCPDMYSLPDTVLKFVANKYDVAPADLDKAGGGFCQDFNDDGVWEYVISINSELLDTFKGTAGYAEYFIFKKDNDNYKYIGGFNSRDWWLGKEKTKGYWDIYDSHHMSVYCNVHSIYKWNGSEYEFKESKMYLSDFEFKKSFTVKEANEYAHRLYKQDSLYKAIRLWKLAYDAPLIYWKPKKKIDYMWFEIANNLGYAYYKNEDYSEAITVLREVIKYDSTRAVAYFNLGEVYEAVADTNLAVENYKKSYQLDSLAKRVETIKKKLEKLGE
jgi:tetratricopeptide (TPR) repeat protein